AAVVPALEVVVRRTILLLRLFPLRFQLLLGAIAAIGGVAVEQIARDLVIELRALRLTKRALVPLQAEPLQIFEHHRLRLARGAGDVGVFDSQNEGALVMPGEEPVEDRRARAADVKVTGWRRCEADADGHAPKSILSEAKDLRWSSDIVTISRLPQRRFGLRFASASA